MPIFRPATMKYILLFFCFVNITLPSSYAQEPGGGTFTNPVLPSGPDPWVTYHDGFYYYTNSTGNRLEIWKTKTMPGLATAPHKTIWKPPVNTRYSKNIWAPELHFLQGKWYMYFAADDGNNANHRSYVLENSSRGPLEGEWLFKGQLGDETNKWAIDASVFDNHGQLYMIWSGWDGDTNGQQNIYIAKMKDPFTIIGDRVKLCGPEFEWEKFGDLNNADNPSHVNVNEGPEILKHGNQLFLIYSASGCWTDHYALGMLTAKSSADLMDPKAWKKSPQPVFQTSKENSVYAPGHNSFFKSPDGKEDWIIYHANPAPGCGCGNKRSPRMQKFTWKKDGSPDFGVPVKSGTPLAVPAG
jgi:GH43 family beta-xylosidase